jgi:hypothetical protein
MTSFEQRVFGSINKTPTRIGAMPMPRPIVHVHEY